MILQPSYILQAGLILMSHGLPIAESQNKVKTLVKKFTLVGNISDRIFTGNWNLQDLLMYSDLFVATNFN